MTKKQWIWVVLILFAMLAQCLYFAWDTGQTVDETFYNGSGYAMVRYNDYQILGEHPPLMMQLGSLPLLFLQPKYPIDQLIYLGDSKGVDISKTGSKFLYEMGNDAHLILFLERIPIIAIGMVLGVFIFLWAYELYGFFGALLSLVLYSFSPNMIAHSSLFTTDFGVTAFMFIALYYSKRFFKTQILSDLILTGVFVGLALLSKVSALILMPIIFLLFVCFGLFEQKLCQPSSIESKTFKLALLCLSTFIFYMAIGQKIVFVGLAPLCLISFKLYLAEEKLKMRKFVYYLLNGLLWVGWFIGFIFLTMLLQKRGLMMTLLAAFWMMLFLVLGILLTRDQQKTEKYGYLIKYFSFIWLLATVIIILDYTDFYVTLMQTKPFHHYIQAFNIVTSHVLSNHKICLAGSFITCDWKYFIGVMSIKTPLVTLMLFFIGLIGLLNLRKSMMDKSLILIPPVVFLIAASFLNTINIGLRHVLPVYPFIFLIAGCSWILIEKAKNSFPKKALRLILTTAIVYFIGSSVLISPYNLSYFNEFVRTPENGAKLVADSNLNWGQDNKRLAELMHRLGNPPVKIANSVNNVPEYNYYRLNWTYWPEEEFVHPKPGFYAMDLMNYRNQNDIPNSWFLGRQPSYKAGKVIYVFEVK